MNILEQKQFRNFDPKIQKLIMQLKIFDYPIVVNGSSSLMSQKYFSDYDLFCNITKKETPQELFNEFLKIFKEIMKDPNTYFMEFKIQTKDGDKIRWYDLDSFNFNEFYRIYDNIDFCKIDLITKINYQFFEVSCIYQLSQEPLKKNNYVKMLKDDIKDLIKDGQYYKALKRKFNIYVAQNNNNKLIELTKIFNSHLGEKYQMKSNLEALKKLLEKTDDDNTIKKIIINLKALHIEPNIKKIDSMINELSNEINNEAKKIKI